MTAEDFIVIPSLSRNPEGLGKKANENSARVPGFRLKTGMTGPGDSPIDSGVSDYPSFPRKREPRALPSTPSNMQTPSITQTAHYPPWFAAWFVVLADTIRAIKGERGRTRGRSQQVRLAPCWFLVTANQSKASAPNPARGMLGCLRSARQGAEPRQPGSPALSPHRLRRSRSCPRWRRSK